MERKPVSDHWLYVLYARETDRIKIGRSSTLEGCLGRLRSCQTGSPEKLYWIAKIEPGAHPGEKAIHAALEDARIHGEWFSASDQTITRLQEMLPESHFDWPSFVVWDSAIASDQAAHFIESEGVYVDRAPVEYEFTHKLDGHTRRGYLYAGYEIRYEALSDDYDSAETPAWVVYDRWRDWARTREEHYPLGVRINWYVAGCATFDDHPTAHDHFPDSDGSYKWTHYFHAPKRIDGKPFNWSDLPIEVKRWHPGFSCTKGGFIEEHTGFRPSPLQPFVTLEQLERLCK